MISSTSNPQSIELSTLPKMNRIKKLFQSSAAYEPLNHDDDGAVEDEEDVVFDNSQLGDVEVPFSQVEYFIFMLLGVAMLWAWNMFLAAAPYFQQRFHDNEWILNHFQPAEVSVSTITSLGSMIVLSKLQKNASYPRRISLALIINVVVFTILALSTLVDTSATQYFGFLLAAIFASSLSTGLIQNGLFAFATGCGKSEYLQGMMTGQAVAGVLPPLVQIISVLALPRKDAGHDESNSGTSSKSAFVYFITATIISAAALLAFSYLLRRQSRTQALRSAAKATDRGASEVTAINGNHDGTSITAEKSNVPLSVLFAKLPFLSSAIVICFAVTMTFPVFTASILSVSGTDVAIFIPLAFLLWNVGDLAGRLSTLSPRVSLTHYPFALFCLAMARLLFVPLYFLCNIKGRGAIVSSDLFYLVVVQFLFGLSNGYLGSSCMMGAGDWVLPEEREATGAFMGLMLVGGLALGSLLSFLLGDV